MNLKRNYRQQLCIKDLHRKVSYQYLIRVEAYKINKTSNWRERIWMEFKNVVVNMYVVLVYDISQEEKMVQNDGQRYSR